MPKFALSLILVAVAVIVSLVVSLLGDGALGFGLRSGPAALMMACAGVTLTTGVVLLERGANWSHLHALDHIGADAATA